ncbi:transporter substrate-binding domain-containing protein [Saccharospirillum mangrovi]|uniref:transporter substrate-binding domain-containing protein n=1 Tax=Saccharospirillum mangrovi TaxID=2161747 RepID=UPI0013006E67|nr:transporter substrate-binding domain-containing protein [Saccharospirillum mangrovi]
MLSLSPLAQAETRIIWAVSELTGLIGLDETGAQPELSGLVGELQQQLLATLPQYDVQPVLMSVPRMQRELQTRDNVCTGIFLRTPEREAYLHYSQPYLLIPIPQIVMSRVGWERLGQPTQIPLQDLLSNDQLNGIRVPNRSYGNAIDNGLNQASNLTLNVTSSTNAIRMLAGGRADFLIEYPTVIAQTLGTASDQLHLVSIGNADPFLEGYVSCNQSALGEAFIADVNEQLRRLVSDPAYRAVNAQLAPSQLQPRLADAYQRRVIGANR